MFQCRVSKIFILFIATYYFNNYYYTDEDTPGPGHYRMRSDFEVN